MAAVSGRLARAGRRVARVGIAGVAVLALLQLVPYGWRHSNPPVTGSPVWAGAEVERLARSACYDCHSNETEWPPYSYVAPMSWLVRYDVDRGREELNFSTWGVSDGEDGPEDDAHDAAEAVEDRSMPPDRYVRLHPDARLADEERRLLVEALEAMDEEGGGDNSGPGGGDGADPAAADPTTTDPAGAAFRVRR